MSCDVINNVGILRVCRSDASKKKPTDKMDALNRFRTIVVKLCLTWHFLTQHVTLQWMQKSPIRAGRPKGARTYDAVVAKAFGEAIQQARGIRGVSQEALAGLAGIERAHVGKIERGEHLPTVVGVFKLAKGLGCEAYELLAWVEALLPDDHVERLIKRAQAGSLGTDAKPLRKASRSS